MDLNSLFNSQNLLQATAVGVIIYFVRLWCETKWATLAQNRLWRGVCLPSGALVVSLLISFLLPVVGAGLTMRDSVLNGLICGFSSSFLFSMFKGILSKEADK
jgi:hypothetical protein